MAYRFLTPIYGIIISVIPASENPDNLFISLQTGNGPINVIVSPETYMLPHMRFKVGEKVVAFYNSNIPVPMVSPPQYAAAYIFSVQPNQKVIVDYFNKDLSSSLGTKKLIVTPDTNVITTSEKNQKNSLGENILLIYYDPRMQYIPTEIIPQKVVVI